MSKKKEVIRLMSLVDQELWKEIEPPGASGSSPKGLRRLSPRKEKEPEKEPPSETKKEKFKREKWEYKREEKSKKGKPLKNVLFSFTSFLIPICITGEKSDYQLLYCICALKNSLKFTSTTLRREGFAQLYMVGMKSKVDWEEVKSNKVSFADIISDFLVKSGTVCLIAAKNKETLRKENNPDAPFVVLLSVADKEIPSDAKVCVGSSWIVFRRSAESRRMLFDREVFNYGRRALTAGICINGCTTTLMTAFKKTTGIHRFIFDTRVGDFLIYRENTCIRPRGNAFSINEGLFPKFTPRIQNWLMKKKNCKDVKSEYYSRYTGGCVTDGYKILITGGLYLSPEDVERPRGRRSLLFEVLPLAYLVEKAGGLATNGTLSILKVKTDKRNQLTHLFLGSADDVEEAMEIVKDDSSLNQFMTKKNETYSDETDTDYD